MSPGSSPPAAFAPLVALPGTASVSCTRCTVARRPRCVLSPPRPRRASVPSPPTDPASAPHALSSLPPPTPTPTPTTSPTPTPGSAGPPPPPSGRSPDFHANVGSVIDALRADYPLLLFECPTLETFRDDMHFTDTSGNQLHGKDAYRAALFLLRAHARLTLTTAALDIVALHYRDEEPAVHVRWRLRAAPRAWMAAAGAASPAGTIVDGLCVYYLDERGMVVHHAMETVVRGGRPMVRTLFERVLTVGQVAVTDGARVPAGNIYGSEAGGSAVLKAMLEGKEWVALPRGTENEAETDDGEGKAT